MSRTGEIKLRRTWHDALVKVRDHGPSAWVSGIKSRRGGARGKMFARMMAMGYVTKPPFTVTPLGERYILLCKSYYRWPDFTLKAIQASTSASRDPV